MRSKTVWIIAGAAAFGVLACVLGFGILIAALWMGRSSGSTKQTTLASSSLVSTPTSKLAIAQPAAIPQSPILPQPQVKAEPPKDQEPTTYLAWVQWANDHYRGKTVDEIVAEFGKTRDYIRSADNPDQYLMLEYEVEKKLTAPVSGETKTYDLLKFDFSERSGRVVKVTLIKQIGKRR